MNLYSTNNPGNPYQGIVSLLQSRLSNPYLQWEETKKLQIGIDLGILNDIVTVTANYIRNRSSNQLLSYNLPWTTGFASIFTNFPALIQNKAWEFSFNAQIIRKKHFNWTANLNITIPENKLIEFPNLSSSSYKDLLVVGKSLSISQYVRFQGVDPLSGIAILSDRKENLTANPNSITDRTIIASPFPQYYGGIENTFEFHGLLIQFLLQFTKQKGTNFYDQGNLGAHPGNFSSGLGNQPKAVLGRWQKPGDLTVFGRYSTNSLGNFSGHRTLEDISFVRIKNVSVSYKFPGNLIKRANLQSLRLFVNAQNLLTFTSYKGLDPEGKNLLTLPPLRVITAGVQLSL